MENQQQLTKLFLIPSSNQIKSKVTTSQNMNPQLNQSQFISKHLLFNILFKLERHYNLKIDKCQQPVSHRKYSKVYLRLNSFENQNFVVCVPEENFNRIGDEGTKSFASAMVNFVSLFSLTLYFEFNKISSDGALNLIQNLKKCTNLSNLAIYLG
ncbi:hypothetical protein ABPG72_012855, partial [Tetrahymena utriculariae]